MEEQLDHPVPLASDPDRGVFGLDQGTETWLSIARRAVAPLIIDQTIGGYELIAELGRGGQGVVYRAVQRSTGRAVALKRLNAPLRPEASSVARFRREVDALVRLRHPNIVMLHDAEVIADAAVLIMECVEGMPLGAWAAATEDGVPRPPDALVDMFLPICDAIVHAHAHGVIHCDLKPSNVMVDSDGRPCVLDFGIARLYGPAGSGVTLSVSQSLAATPNWAAPEQFHLSADAIDVRTDVYALGAILFFLLTGREPFAHTTTFSQVLRAVEIGLLHPPSAARRDLDAVLDAIVAKAMDPDPARRYPAAAMMAADVRDWKAGRTPAGLPVRFVQRARFFMRRRRRAMIAAALSLAMIFVGAGSLWTWSASRERMRNAEQMSMDADVSQRESRLRAAGVAIRGLDAATARVHLHAVPQAARSWEWHMLMRRTDDSEGVRADLGVPIASIAAHPVRSHVFAVIQSDGDRRVIDRSVQPWTHRPLKDVHVVSLGKQPVAFRCENGSIFGADAIRAPQESLRDMTLTSVAPDGRMAVFATADRSTIAVAWMGRADMEGVEEDAITMGPKRTLDQPLQRAACIASRGWVLVMCDDRSLRLLDAGTLEEIGRREFDREIGSLLVNDEGTMSAILSFTNQVEVVDLPSLSTRHMLEGHREIAPQAACFLRDGRHLVTGSWDRTLRVWDLEEGRSVRTMIGHDHYVCDAIRGGTDDRILTVSYDGTIREWNPLEGPAHSRSVRIPSRVMSIIPVPQDSESPGALPAVLCMGTSSSEARVRSFRIDLVTAGCEPIEVMGIPHPTVTGANELSWAVALSRSGDRLAVADGLRSIRLLRRGDSEGKPPWSTEGTFRIPLPEPPEDPDWRRYYRRQDSQLNAGSLVIHQDGPAALSFTPDEEFLLCAMTDGTLVMLRGEDGASVHSMDIGVAAASSIRWIDSARVLICGQDSVAIVEIAAGALRIVARREQFPGVLTNARVARDGRLIAMCFVNGEVWILPAHLQGEPLHRLRGSSASVSGVDFSADGRRLAVAGSDARVRLWDIEIGREVLTLDEHSLHVSDAVFSTDGHWLASAGLDNIVWFRSGQPLE